MCVDPPILLSLNTNDYTSVDQSVKCKFEDNPTTISLIHDRDGSEYRKEVDCLVHWCVGNYMEPLRLPRFPEVDNLGPDSKDHGQFCQGSHVGVCDCE